jgi:hypothetical protein
LGTYYKQQKFNAWCVGAYWFILANIIGYAIIDNKWICDGMMGHFNIVDGWLCDGIIMGHP